MKHRVSYLEVSLSRFFSVVLGISFAGLVGVMLSCSKPPAQPKPVPSRPSDIKVEVRDGGPAVLTTSTSEFQILPSGFLQASSVERWQAVDLGRAQRGIDWR